MSIGSGVVIAITFQKVDNAPHTEASAESDHEGLQNINSRVKEIHIVPPKNIDRFLKARFPWFLTKPIGPAYSEPGSSSDTSTSNTL